MPANAETVDIHGTEYTLIATRLRRFREDHPEWSIITKLLCDTDFVRFKAFIKDENGRIIANGYAEEERGLGNINKTSAVENTETSAVGRALAFVSGEYAGNTIRSAEEMANAISQQNIKDAIAHLVDHNDAWKRHETSIHSIKNHLAEERLGAALEELREIPEDDLCKLRLAPTKGGWMTVDEKKLLEQARKEDFDPVRGVYQSIAGEEIADA